MERWIAEAVGQMHIHGISQAELAGELGVRRDYLNKILNGRETPSGARERVMTAIDKLVAGKSA